MPTLDEILKQVYQTKYFDDVLSEKAFAQFKNEEAYLSAFLYASLHTGKVARAEDFFQKLCLNSPGAQAFYLLGECHEFQGQTDKAIEAYYKSYQHNPTEIGLRQNLSAAFIRHECFTEAILIYQKYLKQITPTLKDYLVFGTLLESNFELKKAAALYQQLLKEHGESYLYLYQRLAYVLKMQGQAKEALVFLKKALDRCQLSLKQTDFHTPETTHWAQVHSEYIQALYLSGAKEDTLRRAQEHWTQIHESKGSKLKHSAKPNESLNIGYISPDFRQSSLSILTYSLLSNHSKKHNYFLYHTSQAQDKITALFESLPHHWRYCGGQTPRQVATSIRGDQIDILVDLSGHTSASCLSLFTHQLAPVQISGLGFNDKTGLKTVQYRFTDTICTPPISESPSSEVPLYLDSWIYCLPPEGTLEIKTPEHAKFTYYSPHHPAKIHPEVLQVWGQILNKRPDSQLYFKHKAFADRDLQKQFKEALITQGAREKQLLFFKASPYVEYLQFYNEVDLILDPFPCHGGMTSCDSLMMGVPYTTLKTWMRGGISLLNQVDLNQWVAETHEDYIQIATQAQRQSQKERQTLSHKFLKSAPCQGKRLAKQVESHYEALWKKHT